jgi:hypothetical protein
LQIKTEYSQPVHEAISGGLTQGHDLTNVGRDAPSQLIEERCWNEIWRSASVVPPSSSRKLSDGVAVLAQNTPDALASILPAGQRLNIFAGFGAAKRRPCARHPKQTTNRGGRVHPSILARLLALSAEAGATSLGAPLLPLRKSCAAWPASNRRALRTCARRKFPNFRRSNIKLLRFHDQVFPQSRGCRDPHTASARCARHHNQQGCPDIQGAQ